MTNPTAEQARKEERDAIVEFLNAPLYSGRTAAPLGDRMWFAWKMLAGNWAVLDGVRKREAQAIQRGDHREQQ